MSSSEAALLERIRGAASDIASFSTRIENERRLPPEVVRTLTGAGVFKLAVPQELGGAEVSPSTLVRVIEAISRVDGSTGWCAMVGATSGMMSGYLDRAAAKEIFGPADAVIAGVFAPSGRATREPGGVRVSGRWSFASGCEHATWHSAGVLVGDPPETLPTGVPHGQGVMLRVADTRVVDTWHTSGLKGTGSHDLEVANVFVPDAHLYSLVAGDPWPRSVLYRIPLFGILAAGVASVAIGIAAGALDAFIELARNKLPPGSKKTIAARELVQLTVATAAAKIGGARALLHDSLDSLTRRVEAGAVSLENRAHLRAAACEATSAAADAVDLVYESGGGSAIYLTSPLQRAFRDVHTTTQHVMVSSAGRILAGRVLLGIETDTTTL